MIRHAEAVLAGHPDKFADQIADRIIEEAYRFDNEAYGQIEVGVWSDRIWLNGGIATRQPFATPLRDLIIEVGKNIGYTKDNHIDVEKYQIDSQICFVTDDPRPWTHSVNDQAICIGWAGYDEQTHYLPPEQFLVHYLRQTLTDELRNGQLLGEGPDGKLLLRIREHAQGWELEHILCTLQHQETTPLMDLSLAITEILSRAYGRLQEEDKRWCRPWRDVELLINPNGPLIEAGSDGDNGQTGRKLVMDYYGPRVPIGGGALSGKHLSHVDRAGAYAARRAALDAVLSGAHSCQVTLAYAPNLNAPLDVCYAMEGRGDRWASEAFNHDEIRALSADCRAVGPLGAGGHFFDQSLPWNFLKQPDALPAELKKDVSHP
jgi:S-adenosylmethionine synthetase